MTHSAPHLPPHLINDDQPSLMSKATSARILGHPLVWLAMTGLFILMGYLWLQYYARPLSERIKQSHVEKELVGAKSGGTWNPEIYRPVTTREKMPITRQADDLRAENYRETVELENKIQPLLVQGRNSLETEVYVGNNQDNAWESYQQVLDMDSEHRLARSGQAQVLGILQGNAEYAAEEHQYDAAEQWLSQLDTIQPDAPFQAELRQRIAAKIAEEAARLEAERREAERIESLKQALGEAGQAMRATPPELRAAYDLYQQALQLDSGNQEAFEGITAIHLEREKIARLAIARKDYPVATSQIERLKQTNADTLLLNKLESTLAYSKAAPVIEQSTPPQSTSLPSPAVQSKPSADTSETGTGKSIPGPISGSGDSPEVAAPDAKPSTKPVPMPEANTTGPAGSVTTIDVAVQKAPAVSPFSTQDIGPARENPLSDKSHQLSTGINAYYAGDYNTAFNRLRPLAEGNSPRAQFRLGIMYYQGRTVARNEDAARKWIARSLPAILRAAQKGQAWAQADLGTAYELGIGVQRNPTTAASWYQKSARQGYVGGQTNLGVLYGTGAGVKYDRQSALYWLKKAAAQGDKIAQDNLKIIEAR